MSRLAICKQRMKLLPFVLRADSKSTLPKWRQVKVLIKWLAVRSPMDS